jgi:replicative DNA helicase
MTHPLPEIPENITAERNLLGAILCNRGGDPLAAAIQLAPEDFHDLAHRKVFEAILQLDDQRKPVEEFPLCEMLNTDPGIKARGGPAFISSLADGVHKAAPFDQYIRAIKDCSIRRRILALSMQTTARAADRSFSKDDLIESIEMGWAAIREDSLQGAKGFVRIAEVSKELEPILSRVGEGKGVMLGSPTGFPDLDRCTAGWIPGELVVVAGRPSSGKTALGLEMLLRQARQGNAVAMFSLEMSRASILLRLGCREGRVSQQRIRLGSSCREEWKQLTDALARVSEMPVWIDDRPAVWAHDLRWRLRSLARRQPIKLGVVDYLQLVRAHAENRTQEVTKISIELKAAARELGEESGGTLIAISQLNRLAVSERPQLHHLRESGQIEQDADTVLLISDEDTIELGQPDPSVKLLDIAKQRNGPNGTVRLTFLPAVMGFEAAERRHQAATEPATSQPDVKARSAGESVQ